MAMSRTHRHSSRNRNPVFPQLPVVAPTPTCGACSDGYFGCHPHRQCFTPAEVDLWQRLAELEGQAHTLITGITCRTIRTEIDNSLTRLHRSSQVLGDVMTRDPKERDFSPTALWTLIPEPTHVALPTCSCIECKLDANTMPEWISEWLNRGSQADLPIRVVDADCGE